MDFLNKHIIHSKEIIPEKEILSLKGLFNNLSKKKS